jgi:ubiquinone biosynthesis protein COQ9
MMVPPERSPERDAAIEAMLPFVPRQGWTPGALRSALGEGREADQLLADQLFPGGNIEMIEAFSDLADRKMLEEAARLSLSELRTPERVRAVLVLRLQQNRDAKEAVRRAVGVLALPANARLAVACTARTVDAVWRAAGDTATDFSWYTKRAILAPIYAATLLFWLRDHTEDQQPTLAFLDRRLRGVGRIGRARRRLNRLRERLAAPLPRCGC